MEFFYTLQGEGFHGGKAAYFIRLAGCDVGCVWCDVKESWDVTRHPSLQIEDLLSAVASTPARIVVVTGGEPLMHDLGPLTGALKAEGYLTHLETSGAWPMSGEWDWVCLSPKKFKAPLPEVVRRADELKVVVYHMSDFAWAEGYAEQVSVQCRLYLQPEWEKADTVTPAIIGYIKEHPQWELSLQTHKYLNIP
jgi:7-carboxy-7-deazaguanine synthase